MMACGRVFYAATCEALTIHTPSRNRLPPTDFWGPQADHLDSQICVTLLETLLNNVSQDGQRRKLHGQTYTIQVDMKCFDLIPKLLATAAQSDAVTVKDDDGSDKREVDYKYVL